MSHPFLLSIRSWRFRRSIESAKAAFRDACKPFYMEIAAVEKEADEHQIKVDAGEATWGEFDPDTGAGYNYGEDLSERASDAKDALLMLRKVFAILLYHQWERGAPRWVELKGKPNHSDIVVALQRGNINVDTAQMENLRLLVNCLKHNSKDSSNLFKNRPDWFEKDFDPDEIHPVTGKPYSQVDWESRINITDFDMEEIFNLILKSGPNEPYV